MSPTIIQQIQLSGYSYRGQIINDLIHLERLMDEFLSRHFCNDSERKKEFFELIIANERMSFNSKIQVFEYVLKKHHNQIVIEYPDIFSDIKKLNEERNIVAHYLLDTSTDGIKMYEEFQKIGFVKFRNSTESLPRNNDDINKWKTLTKKYIRMLEDFLTIDINKKP